MGRFPEWEIIEVIRHWQTGGLKHHFSPVRIGTPEFENGVVTQGMALGFGVNEGGCQTQHLVAFYAKRAKGRPGAIAISSTIVLASQRPLMLTWPQWRRAKEPRLTRGETPGVSPMKTRAPPSLPLLTEKTLDATSR